MISGNPIDCGADFFAPAEFERCLPSCKKTDMNPDFLMRLNWLRYRFGKPIVLNSAFRSSVWDKAHGRSGNGYHTLGRACDIQCTHSGLRAEIVRLALDCGFSVGVHKNFIHLDDRLCQILFCY